jgi:dephospho-CoA kinase
MFILGLTGSIGMGKSTTAKFFASEGVPVYDADAAVHQLYEGEAVPLIEAAFPGSTRGGKVDREKLSRRVVGDKAAMVKLEQIVHPLVAKARTRFLRDATRAGTAVVVLDIPLLYETGGAAFCDAVVVVSAPVEVQKQRAFERPAMTDEKFNALLAKQMPDAEKRARADFVVDTSQDYATTQAQVREILAQVRRMANLKN